MLSKNDFILKNDYSGLPVADPMPSCSKTMANAEFTDTPPEPCWKRALKGKPCMRGVKEKFLKKNFKLVPEGCWNVGPETVGVPLEGQGPTLCGHYKDRKDAANKCGFRVNAMRKSLRHLHTETKIGLQNGGWCFLANAPKSALDIGDENDDDGNKQKKKEEVMVAPSPSPPPLLSSADKKGGLLSEVKSAVAEKGGMMRFKELSLGQRSSQQRGGGGAGRAGAALAPWQLYGKAPKGCCSGGGGGGKGCASIFTVVAVLNNNTKPVSKKVKDVLGPSGFDYGPVMGKLMRGEGIAVDLAPTPATTTTTSRPGGRPCGIAGEKQCGGTYDWDLHLDHRSALRLSESLDPVRTGEGRGG